MWSPLLAEPPHAKLIPTLYATKDLEIEGETTGSTRGGHLYQESTAKTNRSAVELEEHFEKQLQAAGYTRLTGQAHRP